MDVRVASALLVVAVGACAPASPVTPPCELPPRDCDGPACAALGPFAPAAGPGYEDVPLEDESSPARSTSYLRRDLMMLVQYATAKVACVASGWPGRGGPLALGDMSDRAGRIPGAARGALRHPPGTHERGLDIDLAYYQRGTPDHNLRAICPHTRAGIDQHHCVGAPTTLDAPRTALLIGTLFESPRVRVVGVDGQAEPAIAAALGVLCLRGDVPAEACARVTLGFETHDGGRGWFYAHHNHLHVSVGP